VDAHHGAAAAGPGQRPVLLAHGLWMTGLETALLRQRLNRGGFHVTVYHYASLTAQAAGVRAALAERIRALAASSGASVHVVGHSLGGVLLAQVAESDPSLPIGRIVLLGAPVHGSGTAHALARLPGGAILLGALADSELTHGERGPWRSRFPLGIIAGTHAIGMGKLLHAISDPNDGTVSVAETRLEGAQAYLEIRASHMGLLLSRAVAANVAAFLASGQFLPRPAKSAAS
jgi:pimeloyl-ACP methyl ester carboxylesterase